MVPFWFILLSEKLNISQTKANLGSELSNADTDASVLSIDQHIYKHVHYLPIK